MFTSILIQTNRVCTRACRHCFYGNYRFTNDDLMSMELIKKILSELQKMDYEGRVSFYGNNEPLTDARIFDILRHAKNMLPKAFHFLQTNGDLMDDNKLTLLVELLDGLQVNVYDGKGAQLSIASRPKVKVVDKRAYTDTDWNNKAGHIKPGTPEHMKECANPFHQMFVHADGAVTVCSADAFAEYPMGNVNEASLKTIWNGPGLSKIRKKLTLGRRQELPLCSKCDSCEGHMMEVGRNAWFDRTACGGQDP